VVSGSRLAVARSSDRLRPVEWLLLGYLCFSSILGLTRIASQPAIGWVFLANLLGGWLVFLLTRPGLGTIGLALREIYPVLLLGALYPAIDILNGFGAVTVHDAAVRSWELRLFGSEVSRTWWQATPSRFWSTVLHAAYFGYYGIVLAPVVGFLALGRAAATQRAVLWIFTTFLCCYVVFLLYPVAGPYYEFPRPAPWFLDNAPARLVYATLERGSAFGAAFPSSHVAATLVATAAAFRGSKLLGWILLVPAILLSVGVVYCQMHYAVDALAGVLLGWLVVAGGIWWEDRLGH
jgi:membrane-associated phospholipid phosphatase